MNNNPHHDNKKNHHHHPVKHFPQQQSQQQQQQQTYEYKFEYSLANYHCQQLNSNNNSIVLQQSYQKNNNTTNNYNNQLQCNYISTISKQITLTQAQSATQSQKRYQQQLILRRSNELILFRCFLNSDTQSLIKTLLTHYINLYTPLALRLLKITQLIFPNLDLSQSSFISHCQQHLDLHRQKLVQSIKQLTIIFYNEKQKYLKLIALVVASAVFKILTLQNQWYELQFQCVFHTVYWQLTGMHSTSQLLKKLLAETFNAVHFHHYLMNQQLVNINSDNDLVKMIKGSVIIPSKGKEDNVMKGSVCFGNRDNLVGNKTKGMNFSVRDFKEPEYNIVESHKIKENQKMTFSKKLLNNQTQQINKQNMSNHLNNPIINKKAEVKQINSTNQQQQLNIDWQSTLNSNKKDFNFKKDRTTFFENFSKTKSNSKKPFADFLSSNKKPTFTSFLQQKRLQFQS